MKSKGKLLLKIFFLSPIFTLVLISLIFRMPSILMVFIGYAAGLISPIIGMYLLSFEGISYQAIGVLNIGSCLLSIYFWWFFFKIKTRLSYVFLIVGTILWNIAYFIALYYIVIFSV